MPLASSMLFHRKRRFVSLFPALLFLLPLAVAAQENSPYSRYGLGDLTPRTNILNRGMGGISAGYSDVVSVNFANPASYSAFQTYIEQRSRQVNQGRVVLDVGINYDGRTLRTPGTTERFSSNNLFFSYVQVGLPLRRNWGLAFGLRPVSRIDYRIQRRELLRDAGTGASIDSAITEFSGNGGAFLPTIGTGFAIGNFSAGFNVGYLFGRKEVRTQRAIFSDTADYANANYASNTFYGDIFFNVGLQHRIPLSSTTTLRLGAAGNWKQDLNATQDISRETFIRDALGADVRVDSIFERNELKGSVVFPAQVTGGFLLDRAPSNTARGWSFGVDVSGAQWKDYRFFGSADSVQNSRELRVGGQISPSTDPGRGGYGRAVTYRAGLMMGRDYIRVREDLPTYGVTFGLGLPLINYNSLARGQFTQINLALEYIRRGNNNNAVRENLFRISAGLNLTDLWFAKRRYE